MREKVRDAIEKVLAERGEAFSGTLVERLTQVAMEEVDEWARSLVESRTEILRDIRGVLQDYKGKPEIGFLTIKHLVQGRK